MTAPTPPSKVHTIVLADDHAMTLSGMASALDAREDMRVVAQADNGIAAVALVKQHQPDLAIFDYVMPFANGHEAFADARRWSPGTKFVISTGQVSTARFRELVDTGIHGIILKTMAPAAVVDAVVRVAAGERVFDENVDLDGTSARLDSLTTREREVLEAIARGHSNATTAERLSLSPKTIDSHRTSLMRKLKVNNTATLIVTAVKAGLIEV